MTITFTSETVGRRTEEPPGSCPRCARTGPAEVSLRTARVAFYRCPACGHMWIVKSPPPAF